MNNVSRLAVSLALFIFTLADAQDIGPAGSWRAHGRGVTFDLVLNPQSAGTTTGSLKIWQRVGTCNEAKLSGSVQGVELVLVTEETQMCGQRELKLKLIDGDLIGTLKGANGSTVPAQFKRQ
jgi:hypothetical protein